MGTNVAHNPSFEDGTLEGWSVTGAGNSGSIVTTAAQDGTRSVRVVGTGTANRVLQASDDFAVPTTPGAVWSAGAWGRGDTGTPRNIRADILFLDASKTVIVDGGTALGTSVLTNGVTFTQSTNLSKVAPALTEFVKMRALYLTSLAANDAGLIDALQLEPGATLPPFNLPGTTGRVGDTLRTSMNRLAGTTGLDEKGAANTWAGTSGLGLEGALNIKAGTSGLGLNLVLNILAETDGLGTQEAARRILGE